MREVIVSKDFQVTSDYSRKPERYFSGARKRFVDQLPPNPNARLLEIGCGNGDTAAYAKSCGKCGWATGVELCADVATAAAAQLDHVLVGDIEELELPYDRGYFDVLIMSEVLEHLRDPWSVLCKLRPYLSAGAIVLAGSPNVAYRGVVSMLLRGRWDYADSGIMDSTHLRWFTPGTYREMFEGAGYRVECAGPATPLRPKAKLFNWLTAGRLQHLLHSQVYVKARCVR